jgi:diguanylate cyclase (GGDEF)-like protein
MIMGSLRSRIVFFFTVLLMIVQLVAFFLINKTSLEIAKSQNIAELNTGKRIFEQLLADNRRRLIDTAALLSADYGFRKAVATHDSFTSESVLGNHGTRIKADMMMLASLDNKIIADTLHPGAPLKKTPLAHLIKVAEQNGEASAFIMLDAHAYQVVVVPVLAPDPIAWVAMGFVVDDHLARQLRDLTNLQVSFLHQRIDNQWAILASTQTTALQSVLLKQARQLNPTKIALYEPITIGDYATLFSVLQQDESPLYTVLQRSVKEAVLPFQQLRLTLFELGLASLLLSVLGGFLLAKKLTDPLKLLADVVDKIQKGDFSQSSELHASQHSHYVSRSASTKEVETLRLAYIEILRLAHEDVLTGLPNRALFNDRLQQMVELAKRNHAPFSVMMSDLNRFKFINDTLGHHAGDEVIRTVGKRLKNALRESDTVARLGGDEFAMLLATGDQIQVKAVAQGIQERIAQKMEINGHKLEVSCSIGIALYPQHGGDAETLMRNADTAMYQAKRAKKSPVIYEANQDDYQEGQLMLLQELPMALSDNQLVLYYQPQVCVATLKMLTAEILIRWQHPIRGLIDAAEFMPFAENAGLMPLMTRWLIQTAIRQCSLWLKQGINLKLCLTISTHDVLDPRIPVLLTDTLNQQDVPASSISLAIDENVLIKSPHEALIALNGLRELGVDLVLHHFGRGYSSLEQLKRLPLSELKIDNVFIHNLLNDPHDKALIGFIVALGQGLGFTVSAEAVNCDAAFNGLKELGCERVQGDWISEPLSADALTLWLAASSRQ